MVLTLDQTEACDPAVAGAKAAWLARGRLAGLSVLPGLVIPADFSKSAMSHGVEMMSQRGSGGARLSISGAPLPDGLEEIVSAGTLGFTEPMVVRSSTILEAGGEWSGAFTSYLEIFHGELAKAVRGCWASAFTVHALERFAAAGLEPGSVPMAVLIQPAMAPEFGGTARLSGDDVLVVGVAGSPAPLVQGWDPGTHARVSASGVVTGDPAIDLMGKVLLTSVAQTLKNAHDTLGATSCEWGAVAGDVTIFQLMKSAQREHDSTVPPDALSSETAAYLARAVRRAPGPAGEALVLPWAVARPELLEHEPSVAGCDPVEALRTATDHAATLIAEVWNQPKPQAMASARETLRTLRSSEPEVALATIEGLRPPDPQRARLVLSLLARVRQGLVEAGAVSKTELAWHVEPEAASRILLSGKADRLQDRIGFDRWEPFDAAVVLSHGQIVDGVSAAPGIAAGRLCFIADPHDTSHFRPRDVVVGTHPLPNLAALLWDAAALVTTGGGPAAHLFESARALAIPAVCGIHLDEALGSTLGEANERVSIAVDGTNGRVSVMPW